MSNKFFRKTVATIDFTWDERRFPSSKEAIFDEDNFRIYISKSEYVDGIYFCITNNTTKNRISKICKTYSEVNEFIKFIKVLG